MKTQFNKIKWGNILSVSLMALLTGISVPRAIAQGEDDAYTSRVRGEVSGQEQTREDGPVRLARFRYLRGGVSYRANAEDVWTDASVNTPLREGAQISVTDDDSRAELQFDDGSILRLGRGALVTLTHLFSDTEGAFTQVKLQDGVASLRLKHDRSVYQVDTPYLTVKAAGPANFRVNVSEDVEVAVHSGKALVESSQGEQNLIKGDFVRLSDPEDELAIRDLPRADAWDRWDVERDRLLVDGERVARRNLPSNIAIVSQELDEYGDWRNDTDYGSVWVPRVSSSDWRPYNDGHWTWVNPFGWTWVSNEAWGWAPYHYGTWVHRGFGWAWVPGPVTQCWSPGVVHFSEYSGGVAWVPLAPSEIRYPTRIGIGSRFSNWSLYFSIGEAGVYYYDRDCFRPRAWNSTYINRSTVIKNTTIVNNNYYGGGRQREGNVFGYNHNTTIPSPRYVPINARLASGASQAGTGEFGRGGYRRIERNSGGLFGEGRGVGAPRIGDMPASGPSALRPTMDRLPSASRNNVPTARSMERRTYSASQERRDSEGGMVGVPTTADQLRGRRAPSTGNSSRPDRARTTDTGSPTDRTGRTDRIGRTGSIDRTVPGTGAGRTQSGTSVPGMGRRNPETNSTGNSTTSPGRPTRDSGMGTERGNRSGTNSGNETSIPRRGTGRMGTPEGTKSGSVPDISGGTETHGTPSTSRRNRTYSTDRAASSSDAARSAREALNGTRRGGGTERGTSGGMERSTGQSEMSSRRSSDTGIGTRSDNRAESTRPQTRTRERSNLPNAGSGTDRASRPSPGGVSERTTRQERGYSPSSSSGSTGNETSRQEQRTRTPRGSETGTSPERTAPSRRERTYTPDAGSGSTERRSPRTPEASAPTRTERRNDSGGVPSGWGTERESRPVSPPRETRESRTSTPEKSDTDKSSRDSGSAPRRRRS